MTGSHHLAVKNPCPTCGKILDGATSMPDETAPPAPGDVTICIYCGSALKFEKGLRLSRLTPQEETLLPLEQRHKLERVRIVVERLRNVN